MNLEMFPDLKKLIDTATAPILVIVVAEGCDKYKGKFISDVEAHIQSQGNKVHVHTICYREDPPMFPRPLTQVVYYFIPRNYTPLFHRTGNRAIMVADDIITAIKMMNGMDYADAMFSDETTKNQFKNTEEMIKTEDTSNFPSLFQQARNFAKEMWNTSKNAAQGLPILVDADTAYIRFETCLSCEELKQDSFRCMKCGCYMKTKTQLASASCPIGKWASTIPAKS